MVAYSKSLGKGGRHSKGGKGVTINFLTSDLTKDKL